MLSLTKVRTVFRFSQVLLSALFLFQDSTYNKYHVTFSHRVPQAPPGGVAVPQTFLVFDEGLDSPEEEYRSGLCTLSLNGSVSDVFLTLD